ncbi:short-chain fatty acid transporter [Helicobacter baculiformis]|uniref:Short-chain fatty acid transporter n=1 Tax=Helicobacter baculiformis TaxID=427351 RepID=A0ABV7ZG38_9HELI|nr:TIGR00366 family protein [Helicobacter baculiformis]
MSCFCKIIRLRLLFFAIVLTLLTISCAVGIVGVGIEQVLNQWGESLFLLLKFSMQMLLLLATGIALAQSTPIKKIFYTLASQVKTPKMAIFVITLIALLGCYVSWGFGLIVGAVFSRVLAQRVKGVDYPLLVASAYSGFLIWHGGLSGSIPLKIATADGDLGKLSGGVLNSPIPLSQTLFAPFNLAMIGLLLVGLPLINMLLHPKNPTAIDPKLLVQPPQEIIPEKESCFAYRLDNSKYLGSLLGVLGLIYLGIYFAHGASLNLNSLILVFLFLGLLLHASPQAYLKTMEADIRSVTGIVLLFPFYAGIIGVMGLKNADGISFASLLADAFARFATKDTFPVLSYLSAGLLNIFIPSGGGQFAVQGPVLIPSGVALGVSPAVTSMSIAWGDAWTNMIQPFFALPLLGIAGLDARSILGYCLVGFMYAGAVSMLCLYFFT